VFEVTPVPDIPAATLCSIPSALARTGIGRSFLYMRLAAGEIRSVKAGRRRLIDVASLDRWAASLPEFQLKQLTAPTRGK